MGPDTESFANLSPVDPNATLRGNQSQSTPSDWETIFSEGGQTMTQDVWNIFSINDILKNWKLLQFRCTNNTGATADIEFGFMRLI